MINYFENKFKNLNLGILSVPYMDYIKNIYLNDIDKIALYSLDRKWLVNGKHPLIRFIKKFELPLDVKLPILTTFNIVKENSEYIGRSIGFCNKYNKGEWFYNESYNGAAELYLIEDEFFNLADLDKWENLTSIEVIFTDNTIIDLPFINMNVKKNNIIIYKINGVLLMHQYLKWAENKLRYQQDIDPGYFINSFLMPKIIKSYLDYTLINILNNLIIDQNYELVFKNTLPISIHDLSKKLKNNYLYVIERFCNKKVMVSKTLSSIPLLFKDNLLELITSFPDTRRQSLWLKYFIKSHEMNIIKNILGPNGIEFNNSIFSGINNEYKEFQNQNITLPSNSNNNIKNLFNLNLSLLYDYN